MRLQWQLLSRLGLCRSDCRSPRPKSMFGHSTVAPMRVASGCTVRLALLKCTQKEARSQLIVGLVVAAYFGGIHPLASFPFSPVPLTIIIRYQHEQPTPLRDSPRVCALVQRPMHGNPVAYKLRFARWLPHLFARVFACFARRLGLGLAGALLTLVVLGVCCASTRSRRRSIFASVAASLPFSGHSQAP